ncbi:MAG: hypothetical protein K2W96_16505 [Gemmataceae bacterium]|nr:hypothetical protein [Gemmataceae bacterium]
MTALLCLCLLAADAEPEKKEDSSHVSGTATVPADAASFKGRVLEIQLWKHDPRIADKKADLVEKAEVKDFAHTKGKATEKAFSVGKKEKLDSAMSYYVTFFVLEKGERTHMGRIEGAKEPFNKVLTNGHPRKLKIVLDEVKR